MKATNTFISNRLRDRVIENSYRSLSFKKRLIDFCSNDYLGFSQSSDLQKEILMEATRMNTSVSGSTGARLISGNDLFTETLEKDIARFHNAEAGLIFNSGYDANLGIFSSLPQRGDTIICDELIHASIIDGCRLSFANRYSFAHNNLQSLEEKLKVAKGRIYIAIESVYSMDGDEAPLLAIQELADKYDAALIVDEAHTTGIFGKRGEGLVVHYNLQDRVFARIVTFGKALGCHGAVIIGSDKLRQYLVNFARSFIYTTAASPFNHLSVALAYQYLQNGNFAEIMHQKIALFKKLTLALKADFIESRSPIQCLIYPGNENVKKLESTIKAEGFDVRAILHPTVPLGKERLRFCLHTFNSDEEITKLTQVLKANL